MLAAISLAPAACMPVMSTSMSADAMPRPAPARSGAHYSAPSARAAAPVARASAPAAPAAGSMAAQVEQLINAARSRAGCRPLQWDAAAAAAAQQHSDDMASRHYFSHTSPEGRTVVDRLRAHGADFRALAENVAMGQQTPQEVVNGWMNSPGHRRNIMDCTYTRSGIGFRDNRWTQVFYTPLR
jgi:uncharacterized protein YkwD